jgi:hypothetical protein
LSSFSERKRFLKEILDSKNEEANTHDASDAFNGARKILEFI